MTLIHGIETSNYLTVLKRTVFTHIHKYRSVGCNEVFERPTFKCQRLFYIESLLRLKVVKCIRKTINN